MSLYDEALLAGSSQPPGEFDSIMPGQALSPEWVAWARGLRPKDWSPGSPGDYIGGDINAFHQWMDNTYEGNNDLRLAYQRGMAYGGTGDAGTNVWDPAGDWEGFTKVRPDTGGKLGDAWDKDGRYIGTFSPQDGGGRQMNQAIAMMAAGYFGGNYLNGLNEAAVAGAGNAGLDAAMIDMGAGATNVGGSAGQLGSLAPAVTDGAASQTIEVIGQRLPQATLSAEELALGAPAIEELGTIPQSEPLDPTDYSNEGRNYPTPNSTQGPGGSPINSSMVPVPNGSPTVTPNIPKNQGGTNPFGTGDLANLFNVLSGLYGMKLAGDAAEKSDPFGPYRKGYADRLQALEANPGLLKSTPGYLGGLDAIQRQMAAKGYLGSGNMAGALMRYSGDSYHNEANRLATLAGANIDPGQTYFNQARLTGQSLSNIGYGLMPYMQGGPR